MFRLSNISIGTKLAITSGIGILLVAAMIASQFTNGRRIDFAVDASNRKADLVARTLEAKAELRGMQLGVARVTVAEDAPALTTQTDFYKGRDAAFLGFLDTLFKTAITANTQAKLKILEASSQRYTAAANEIIAAKSEMISLVSKAAGAPHPAPMQQGSNRLHWQSKQF
jgi:hypothetical protein